MTARILALCNQKGGVGKSTTLFQLARAAVLAGRRVLAVDNDPQGNLTSNITAEEVDAEQAGLADVLSTRADDTMRDVIVPGLWPGLDVVPTSGVILGSVRDELVVAGAGREVDRRAGNQRARTELRAGDGRSAPGRQRTAGHHPRPALTGRRRLRFAFSELRQGREWKASPEATQATIGERRASGWAFQLVPKRSTTSTSSSNMPPVGEKPSFS